MMLKRSGNQKGLFQGLWSAIQFLTILPCPARQAFNARAALPYFPMCGLAIGAVVVAVDILTSLVWPKPVVAMMDIVALAVISGALHLDGLADTADGLYGRREPEQVLAIMKDSRVGAMGVVAVVFCLALKWVGVANLATGDKIWLLIVPAYARASVLFATRHLPYGRPEGGTGLSFFDPPLQNRDFWGFGLIVMLSILTMWGFIKLNIGFALIAMGLIGWYRRKINCVTGDMLGALIEITETGLFLMAASHWSA